jgi:hypothetical protein
VNLRLVWLLALIALGCGAGSGPVLTQPTVSPGGTWSVDQAAYLQSLARIDEGLAVDDARALRGAEQTCADLADGLRGRELTERVRARLSGIDATQAREAIALMTQRICPAG